MKRNVFLAVLFALAFVACKKDKDIVSNPPPAVKQDPTLKRDSTYPNKTIIVPKIDTVIGSIILDTKDAQGMTAIGSSVKFAFAGAFKPSEDLRNVYFVVKDAGTVVFTSENKLTVNDAVNSFTQTAFLSFTQAKVYVVEVHADVLASATDNAGIDDQCTVTFDLVYQANGNSTNKTLSATAQTLTFRLTASSTLSYSLASYPPPGYIFIPGETFEADRLDFTSTGGTSIITKIDVLTFGGYENIGDGISQVKVYDGATLLGTGTFVARHASVNLNLNVDVGVTKTLSFKLVVGQVTDLASVATGGQSTEFGISQVSYTDAGGVFKTLGGTGGAKFALLRAKQIVTSINLPGVIQNGLSADLYKWKVESVGGPTANKQFAVQVNITDNGPNLDTPYLKNFYLKVNGSVVNARFTNVTGQIIDSIGPGVSKLYITFVSGSGEVVTPVGSPTDFVIGGKFGGFNHPLNGDNASLILTSGPVLTDYTFRYVNSGIVPNNLNAKVYSSPIANAGALVLDYIWSDLSASAHSFVFGAGSMDAKSDIGVTFNVAQQVWVQ